MSDTQHAAFSPFAKVQRATTGHRLAHIAALSSDIAARSMLSNGNVWKEQPIVRLARQMLTAGVVACEGLHNTDW